MEWRHSRIRWKAPLEPRSRRLELPSHFGTYTEQDRHYNTNRQWYIQKLFNPEIEQDPQDGDIPFIRKAAKKITKEDIEFALGSHYQDTPYDPFG